METDLAVLEQNRIQEALNKLPLLQLGPSRTYLHAYRITPHGIFFIEANDQTSQSCEQVNFVTSGIILRAAGDSFRDDEIGKIMAANALGNVLQVSNAGLVAC